MSAIKTTNRKGMTFIWYEGNPYIEVFRKKDPLWSPFLAILAHDVHYNTHALKEFANAWKS